jgi:hypothetical protein
MPSVKKVTPKKPAAKSSKKSSKSRKPKVFGYVIEETVFDFNDEYYSTYRDDAAQLATNRVFKDKAEADELCRNKNRGQVDTVLASPRSWAGYGESFGQYLNDNIHDSDGTKFVKVCDVLLPKKKYPDLDRDDHKACADELDAIVEFDLDLTDAQRDKLIKNGPDIFSIFRVSKVEIV